MPQGILTLSIQISCQTNGSRKASFFQLPKKLDSKNKACYTETKKDYGGITCSTDLR